MTVREFITSTPARSRQILANVEDQGRKNTAAREAGTARMPRMGTRMILAGKATREMRLKYKAIKGNVPSMALRDTIINRAVW